MTTGSNAPYNEQQNFPVINSAIYMIIKTDTLIENLEQSIAQDSPGNTTGRLKPRAHIHCANIKDSYNAHEIHKPLRKRRGYLEIRTRGSAEWMKWAFTGICSEDYDGRIACMKVDTM
ncbi:hypothetical protein BEWA_026650 [Theileria equi strain WA]|uniref:Uncharacterized protein n=1 Tax=Theileria equi strain WA TaxID=1537102 RepID=L0AXS1_THEEQ|nr:hypothetical protein BEWA_026650 [Theileria equi strain WA]AFZ79816.1 hypothetical protein BEWA_026650 [Theileria equi strain WA]|eukprot:XP_004829482.1 hypothetical protein BEWA_026650 [Theileria equi strain WA]